MRNFPKNQVFLLVVILSCGIFLLVFSVPCVSYSRVYVPFMICMYGYEIVTVKQ